VTDEPYVTATIAGLERTGGWSPIRRELDVRAFGINAWTAHEAGATLINEHDEDSGHEELYVVTTGHATFTVAGDEIDAPAGTIVLVRDPKARRGAVAREAGTIVVSVGGPPGEAYKPLAWETNADVLQLFERGEYAEARRVLTEALDRYEEAGALLYNLACAEARLGNTNEAFERLRPALEGRPALRELAREDEDLQSLRGDPRFEELTA
jgi:tetratricopeptide (TPR) repeat protein